MSQKPVLILSPLRDEMGPVLKQLSHPQTHSPFIGGKLAEKEVLLSWSGVGKQNLTSFVDSLPIHEIRGVIFMGCAGAIQPEIKAETLVLCRPQYKWRNNQLIEDSPRYNQSWEKVVFRSCPSLAKALSVTVEEILRDPAEKKALGKQCDASVVEMENFHLAEQLSSSGLPLLFLRVILDGVDRQLPDLGDFSKIHRPSVLTLIKTFLLHPSQMIYLARTFPRCAQKLADQIIEILKIL